MKLKNLAILAAVVTLASVAACITEEDNPLVPPASVASGALLVDTGYTQGSEGTWLWDNLGEYSAFTMRWEPVENADYYEIRASEVPITTENWDEAIPMEIVYAPADSALAFNVVQVQTEPCIACGLCEQVCPIDAITVQGGVAVIDYDRCTSCGLCMDECPVDAITGTRNGVNYYFGIRAYFEGDQPAEQVAVTNDSYRIILFNSFGSLWGPFTKGCGLCEPESDTLGCFSGCHIVEDYNDAERLIFTGEGCQYDAIWQDTAGVGPVPYMVYIDYDKCVNCGVCFVECWNYNQIINSNADPNLNYEGLKSMMHEVVPSGWVNPQPVRP